MLKTLVLDARNVTKVEVMVLSTSTIVSNLRSYPKDWFVRVIETIAKYMSSSKANAQCSLPQSRT